VVKIIRFIGRAAHPGGASHKGTNAINAANLALAAVELLWGDAEKAKEILAEYRPAMTKGESLHLRKVCSGRNCTTEKRGSPNCGEDLQIAWGSYSGL
jgi:hypothetical protein